MRIIKIFVITILSLAGLYVIISAVLPGRWEVKRSVMIDADPNIIFNEINNFENFGHWSPWRNYDTDIKTSIVGRPEQSDYSLSWKSENKKVGSGVLRRIKSIENKAVYNEISMPDYRLIFMENWNLEAKNDSVNLVWINFGTITFASRIPMNIMNMEKILGPELETGLKQLKTYCEGIRQGVKRDPIQEIK